MVYFMTYSLSYVSEQIYLHIWTPLRLKEELAWATDKRLWVISSSYDAI